MRISAIKREENIVEYILYMWQIESLIRANDFDIQNIKKDFLDNQIKEPKELKEYEAWYLDLIKQMKTQGIEKAGHLAQLNDLLMELLYLHNMLLSTLKDNKYRQIFEDAIPDIEAFQEKTNVGGMNFIETLLFGMNAQLLFRLQNKAMTKDTERSFDKFRKVLAYLADQYKKMQKGTLNIHNN